MSSACEERRISREAEFDGLFIKIRGMLRDGTSDLIVIVIVALVCHLGVLVFVNM